MKSLFKYTAMALAIGLGSVLPAGGTPPEQPTLLFHNDGTRSLRVFVDGIYLGTVGMNRQVCFRLPFRPGFAQLEARSPNGRLSVLSPPIVVDEVEGWYWRIGSAPERDAKLSLRATRRCEVR